MSNHWRVMPLEMLVKVARSRQRTLDLYEQSDPGQLHQAFSDAEIRQTISDALETGIELQRRWEEHKKQK